MAQQIQKQPKTPKPPPRPIDQRSPSGKPMAN